MIREALPTDIEALALIEADRFRSDRLSRRSLLALTRSPSARVLVACRRDAVIGYAVLLIRRGSRRARLYSIAVAAAEASRGLGARLLAAAEDAARALGVSRIALEVRADNPAAIKLYRRRGYRQIGERPSYYDDGMTALLFARELSPGAFSTCSEAA